MNNRDENGKIAAQTLEHPTRDVREEDVIDRLLASGSVDDDDDDEGHAEAMENRRAARRSNSQTPEALARTAQLEPHIKAHAEWAKGDRSKPFHGHHIEPKPAVRAEPQHARGQHPDHCGACRAHTVVDEVESGARPHEHATAEFPDRCGICRAQQVEAEEHPHADV